MVRTLTTLATLATLAALLASVALLIAAPAVAAPGEPAVAAKPVKPAKKHAQKRIPRGLLPGVRTPEQIERDRRREVNLDRRMYYRAGGPRIGYWGYSDPRFHRSRWNGGSFGPCWTSTPIGYQWNCGH